MRTFSVFLLWLNCFFTFQASAHNKNLDVGANVFIGNLDPEIDEKLLYDTFSAFGVILQTPKVCLLHFFMKSIHMCFFFCFVHYLVDIFTEMVFQGVCSIRGFCYRI